MNLAIDIGNTNIKHAIFQGKELLELGNSNDLDELRKFLQSQPFEHCAISSVKFSETEIQSALGNEIEFLYLSHQTEVPIKVDYDTPETLGMDRLAAVIGAREIFHAGAIMVIDIGTCITYDFLDEDDVFRGGAISPGVDLKFKAVHDYTARLPLVTDRNEAEIFGRNTYDSIKSGVINGTAAEIEGMISQFMLKNPDLKVIITGGGAKIFESRIKADIFVALEIVLVGLNRVLEYNAQKL